VILPGQLADIFTEIRPAVLTAAAGHYSAAAVCLVAGVVKAGSAMAGLGTVIAPSRSAVSRQP
jgi:hypothetical protein